MIYKLTNAKCRGCNIVTWIRMTWSMPAAVPQMMLCLIKLMKHTVICSLLLSWRHSTWLGKHNISVLVNSVKTALISYNLKFVCIISSCNGERSIKIARFSPQGDERWMWKYASLSRNLLEYYSWCTLSIWHCWMHLKHLSPWYCGQHVLV